MSRRRRASRQQNVHGVLLLDKPLGASSNQVLQQVKRLFNASKAGHTGSLDPMASGLLPICFGEATKISAHLLDADKHYRTQIRLGVTTTTGDAEGDPLQKQLVPEFTTEQLEVVLATFRGKIQQIPPMYSALKKNGKRLYELAREGKTVEREPRQVMISNLRLLNATQDTLMLDVSCSKGTYIRVLAEDIGQALGCGAHVIELRRTGVDPFVGGGMVTMAQLNERIQEGQQALSQTLIPADAALSHWPAIKLNALQWQYISHGRALDWDGDSLDRCRLYAEEHRFVGIGKVSMGRLQVQRLMHHDLPEARPANAPQGNH